MVTHRISRVLFDNLTAKNTNPQENFRVDTKNPNLKHLKKNLGFESYLEFQPKLEFLDTTL
jgi:hypothetical protein